ncbi:hypothetical protein Tco_0919024, partial [Tanacetum coccineum]
GGDDSVVSAVVADDEGGYGDDGSGDSGGQRDEGGFGGRVIVVA